MSVSRISQEDKLEENAMSQPTLSEIIGDPKRLDADLQKFQKDTKLLSTKQENFLKQYSDRWIALYDGKVRADAASMNLILTKLDELNLPREQVVIRFMNQKSHRMIL